MKTRRILSFFAGVPSWALSIIAVVLIAVFIGIINDIGEVPSYLIYAVLVITASLLIAWNNPRSAWYVPIICNMFSFLMAVLDDSFWTSSACSDWQGCRQYAILILKSSESQIIRIKNPRS